jgi:hypothetical protein
MASEIDYYVKCWRCGQLAETTRLPGGLQPPDLWEQRDVIQLWTPGALPDRVLLCRRCVEDVDSVMRDAWGRALARPATARGSE